MTIGDFIKGVATDVLQDLLKKATGTTKRRKRRLSPQQTITKAIEDLISKPAKRQTSRKRTVRARSKARRRAY